MKCTHGTWDNPMRFTTGVAVTVRPGLLSHGHSCSSLPWLRELLQDLTAQLCAAPSTPTLLVNWLTQEKYGHQPSKYNRTLDIWYQQKWLTNIDIPAIWDRTSTEPVPRSTHSNSAASGNPWRIKLMIWGVQDVSSGQRLQKTMENHD